MMGTSRFLLQIHVNFSLCRPVLSRSANLADHCARRHCASQRGVFANETANITLAFRANGIRARLRDNDPERSVSPHYPTLSLAPLMRIKSLNSLVRFIGKSSLSRRRERNLKKNRAVTNLATRVKQTWSLRASRLTSRSVSVFDSLQCDRKYKSDSC